MGANAYQTITNM